MLSGVVLGAPRYRCGTSAILRISFMQCALLISMTSYALTRQHYRVGNLRPALAGKACDKATEKAMNNKQVFAYSPLAGRAVGLVVRRFMWV